MTDALQQLLWDLDESLQSEGYVPLYSFSWWLRGQRRGLSEEQIAELCDRAYGEFVGRHSVHLEWLDSPDASPTGRHADPDARLDFDIRTRGRIDGPFLALVPDDQAHIT